MPHLGTCLTMDRNPRECAIASTRSRWNGRKIRKRPGLDRDAFFSSAFLKDEGECFRQRGRNTPPTLLPVALAIPGSQEQHFGAGRIFENVIGGRMAVDFVKTGRRGSGRVGATPSEAAQFIELFLRVVSQIFHQGRCLVTVSIIGFLRHIQLISSPPVRRIKLEMFRGHTDFFRTNCLLLALQGRVNLRFVGSRAHAVVNIWRTMVGCKM